jgi:hypothetical protein
MKRRFKKMIVCIAAGIMIMTMSAAPVFASSPIADKVDETGLPAGIKLIIIDINTPENNAAAKKAIGVPANDIVFGLYDIYPSSPVQDGSYQVSLVLAGQTLPVTVYRLVNDTWVALPTTYVNNTVTFTTPNFSHFAFVSKGNAVPAAQNTNATGGTTPLGKSPKTGDSTAGLNELLLAIMIIGAIGAFYTYRRTAKAKK